MNNYKKKDGFARKIALCYFVISVVYIFASDIILSWYIGDVAQFKNFQTIKAIGFITLSSLLLYYSVRSLENKLKTNIAKLGDTNDELNHSKEFFKILTEQTIIGIGILDRKGTIKYLNPVAEGYFGYKADELQGQNISRLIHPKDLTKVMAILRLKGKLHEGTIGKYRFLNKNGRKGYLEFKSVNMQDNNFVGGILVSFQDITKQVKRQMAIKNQRKYLEHIINAVPLPFWSRDINGRFKLANQAFANILHQPIDEIIGRTIDELIDDRKRVEKSLQRDIEVLLSCEPSDKFEEILTEDDTHKRRWFETTIVPLIMDTRGVEALGVSVEVTDRKISERKLAEQNKKLTMLNKELDRFAYSASHELRSPLTSLLGLINLTEIEMSNEVNSEYLAMMRKTISKMDMLLRAITMYSQNKQSEVKYEEVHLQEIIQDAINEKKILDQENRMRVHIKPIENARFISDAFRVRLIIDNLISNAFKYQNYENRYSVLVIEYEVDTDRTYIHVTDNGIGISRENLEKVFDMFHREETNVEGTGLGLYIVKQAISKLGGKIFVDSLLGEGTKFILEIPNNLYDYKN